MLFRSLFPAVDMSVKESELGEKEREALEEERRLFYVAVTRARVQLELLTYAGKFGELGGTKSTFVSQLLGETQSGVTLEKRKKTLISYQTKPALDQIAAWENEYQVGMAVEHKQFGRGREMEREGEEIEIPKERRARKTAIMGR